MIRSIDDMNMGDDFEVIKSPLCQDVSVAGESVTVEIYGDGNGKWILEVVDKYNNSTVWDDPFDTDQQALDQVFKTIAEEGIGSLICTSYDQI